MTMIDLMLLKEHPELVSSIRVEITGADLLAFGETIHEKAVAEAISKLIVIEEYLTPKQFAEALQVSQVTLWNWDKKGITKPLRIGKHKRYRRSDIEKILSYEK